MTEIEACLWAPERVVDALDALARASNIGAREVAPVRVALATDRGELTRQLVDSAAWLGVEAVPVVVEHESAHAIVDRAGPALLLAPQRGPLRTVIALVGRRGRDARLLGPDGRVRSVRIDALRDALCAPAEAAHLADVDTLLDDVAVAPSRRARARRLLLADRLVGQWVASCVTLRPHAGAPLGEQLARAGLVRKSALLVAAHVLQTAVGLIGWWLIGAGLLEGRIDRGWLLAWLLVLLTLVPLRALSSWLQGRLAVDGGAVLRQRLMAGSVALDLDSIRHQGVGQLLGRVLEASSIDRLAVTGALGGALAIVELAFAALTMGAGSAGALAVVTLVAFCAAMLALVWRDVRARQRFARSRLDLTHDLVARIIGHRTRLQQESAARWHEDEDRALTTYLERARDVDRSTVRLSSLLTRGWLLVGLAALATSFVVSNVEPDGGSLALGLGGALLARMAFERLAASLPHLADAWIGWQHVRPLVDAAAPREMPGRPSLPRRDGAPVLEARELTFRHGEGAPVLQGASLVIHHGERVLCQGASGGGKSTLASLLVGLRDATSGLVLAGGSDRRTLGGAGWRRRIASAPQFHENHILSSTLAFNVLLGRCWPPTAEDLAEAEAVCRELGLGALLDRMPGGMMQFVGETGWQLSHGERSRVFTARALLQGAELVVLDESFAALDPETTRQCLDTVVRRAPSLFMIAHP